MALDRLPHFVPVRTMSGNSPEIRGFGLGVNNAPSRIGQVVMLNANRLLEVAGAAAANILGVYAGASHDKDGPRGLVWLGNPDTVFEGKADDNVTQAMVGSEVDLVIDGDGNPRVDVGASAVDIFHIFAAPVPGTPAVQVRFNAAKYQLGAGNTFPAAS